MAIRNALRRFVLLMVSLLILGGVVFTAAPRLFNGMATAARFAHINGAMNQYHHKYGAYPPQYLADEQGKPAHSWRVLLLEFVRPELYRRYRFDEPWDGPHNRLLATEMPEEYRSPFADAGSPITQYVGIAGESTAWQGTRAVRREEFHYSESTPPILFVEAANSDIHWMEPRDIPLGQASAGINLEGEGGIRSNYTHGLPVQTPHKLNMSWVPSDIPSEKFRSMLIIAEEREDESQEHEGESKGPEEARGTTNVMNDDFIE